MPDQPTETASERNPRPQEQGESFGDVFKRLMRSGLGNKGLRKWKVEALAAAVGVEPETISNWRNYRSLPTRKHYDRLLTCFELDRDNLQNQEFIQALDEALSRERKSVVVQTGKPFLFLSTTFPTIPSTPVSRAAIGEWLDNIVLKKSASLCVLVASGGSGKTTAVRFWLQERFDELSATFSGVFLWSSYRQGQTTEFVSVDSLFDSLSGYLGLHLKRSDNTRSKMLACLETLKQRPTLIVADGLESLQYPPGDETTRVGRFKDNDAQEFFSAMAVSNASSVIVTTRVTVSFADRSVSERVPQRPADRLTAPELLALLRSQGLEGSDSELAGYVEACRGHSLTLALLAHFIRRAFKDRLPTLAEIKLSDPASLPEAKLAERVLDSYFKWLPGPQAALLATCGVFDQPMSAAVMYRVVASIGDDLTFRFEDLHDYRLFRFHLETLKATGLVYEDETADELVDVHPIVREYLGTLLRRRFPLLWTTANRAMYDILADADQDDWRLRRIVFGCRGGLQQRAYEENYEPRFSKFRGTLSDDATVSYSQILYALGAFFQSGGVAGAMAEVSAPAKETILLDAIAYVTALRGYADQQLPVLFEHARSLVELEQAASVRISYSECRFQRMAGNLDVSKKISDRLLENGRITGNKSLLVGALRNSSAYYFYIGDFARSKRLALEGEAVGYKEDWTTDEIGFVNNPLVMLPGYAALASAMLGEHAEAVTAIHRMEAALNASPDPHSRAIAAFIDAMLADLCGALSWEKADRFERLALQGELSQWLVAANIMKAAVSNLAAGDFDRLIRRWRDTGAKLFVPYWYALAGEAASRRKDGDAVHRFSALGLAVARTTGEIWTNWRLQNLSMPSGGVAP